MENKWKFIQHIVDTNGDPSSKVAEECGCFEEFLKFAQLSEKGVESFLNNAKTMLARR